MNIFLSSIYFSKKKVSCGITTKISIFLSRIHWYVFRPKYLYLIRAGTKEFKITGFINLQQKPHLSKRDSLISSKDLGEIWTKFFFSNIVFTAMVMAN